MIVVGREDTGEVEAQVRGSRHAWDIRLISADALIKLVQLKENAEGPETGRKIRSLLVPREYTRLDDMVDVMFSTAKDMEIATEAMALVEEEQSVDAGGSIEKRKGCGSSPILNFFKQNEMRLLMLWATEKKQH